MSQRPRILESAYAGYEYDTALNFYDYLNSSKHGLFKSTATSNGAARWYTVDDVTGSGVITMCWYAAKNSGPSAKTHGLRITVDGAYVFNDTSDTVAGSTQTGKCVIGRVFFRAADTPCGVVTEDSYFDEDLKIEIYVDDPSIDVVCAYKYFLTI